MNLRNTISMMSGIFVLCSFFPDSGAGSFGEIIERNTSEKRVILELINSLPLSRIDIIEGCRPSRISLSEIDNSVKESDPSFKSKGPCLWKGEELFGINGGECLLKIEIGSFREGFMYLNYYWGIFKIDDAIELFKQGYSHDGVKESFIGGHIYWFVDKDEGTSEPIQAITVFNGGLLEGDKRDVESVLTKYISEHKDSIDLKILKKFLNLIDLDADKFFLHFRDREAIKVELLQEIAVETTDFELYTAAEDVVAWGVSQYWGESPKLISSFLFENPSSAAKIAAHSVKRREYLLKKSGYSTIRDQANGSEKDADTLHPAFNSFFVKQEGEQVVLVYSLIR